MKYDKDSGLWWLAVTGILKGYTEWRKVRGWRTFSMEWIYLRKYVFTSGSFHRWSKFNGIFSEKYLNKARLEKRSNEVSWEKGRIFLTDSFHLLFYAYLLVECFVKKSKIRLKRRMNEAKWIYVEIFSSIRWNISRKNAKLRLNFQSANTRSRLNYANR